MEVKREKKPVNIPLPNVALFLIITIAFFILMSENHMIIKRLMLGTLESDGEMVLATLLLLGIIMAFGGWVYHIKWQKKVKAVSSLGNHPNVSHNPDKKAPGGRSVLQLLRQNFYKKKGPDQQTQA